MRTHLRLRSPLRTPAEVAEVAWPCDGVKVTVGVEHLTPRLRLGDNGVSEGFAADEPTHVLVRMRGAAAPVRLPREILVPEGKKTRPLRFWDRMSHEVKKGLLMIIGVGDPRREAFKLTPKLRLTVWGE